LLRVVRSRIIARRQKATAHSGSAASERNEQLAASLASKLGLENGDRIETLLGKPLDTSDHIAAAFEALKSATTIDVTVSRQGAPLRIVTFVE
jgi:hypothetical protein